MSVKVLHRGPDLIGDGKTYWVVLCGCGNKFVTADVWEFTDDNWTKALAIDANMTCARCYKSAKVKKGTTHKIFAEAECKEFIKEETVVVSSLIPPPFVHEVVSEIVLERRAEFAAKVTLRTYKCGEGGSNPFGKTPTSERPGWYLWEEQILREFKNIFTITEIYELFFESPNAPYKKRSLEDVHGMALWVQETAPAP